jgi:hypothetical protein
MSQSQVTSDIAKAVVNVCASAAPAAEWIVPLGNRTPSKTNHFVLFLKPELLAGENGARIAHVLDLIHASLHQHGVETGATRVINGAYLACHKIMQEHYGVINRASRLGLEVVSAPTRQKLESEFPGIDDILGGHQFLERYPQVSAFALSVIATSLGAKKVAGGMYASLLDVQGKRMVIINAFHPQQLLHYTRPGQAIVVLECSSDTDWRVLRQQMTGATDPARAEDGSIRRTLLQKQAELGLPEITMATNGVHCSAGPLEAMLEYCRFFSDDAGAGPIAPGATPFGRMLLARGLAESQLAALADNPLVGEGSAAGTVFDLTEDKNADQAATILVAALGTAAASGSIARPVPETCSGHAGVALGAEPHKLDPPAGASMDAKTLIIAVLAVAVAVLGYLYYEHSRHGITIDTPAVKIEAK